MDFGMLSELLFIWIAVLGAIIGSFINALVFRFNSGETMMGRSHCMECKHVLSVLDLIPFFSYVFLRGKCRYCGEPISLQYPTVEIIGALLAVGVLMLNPLPLSFLLGFFFWMAVLFATVYDFRYQELPNDALLVIGLTGLATVFVNCDAELCRLVVPNLWSLLSGPLVALPLLAISAFSREQAMGWGDGLLMLGFGWMLGLTGGYSALFIGVWAGAIVGLLMVARERMRAVHAEGSVNGDNKVTMKSRIPFAPFLALGALAVYFFHANFLAILLAY